MDSRTVGALKIVGILLVTLLLLAQWRPADAAGTGTQCDEWANFTKIITYRFRDDGQTREKVKQELERVMGKHPDIGIGLSWIDYSYDHPETDPVTMWENVFSECSQVEVNLR
jgi:hypothetical protein